MAGDFTSSDLGGSNRLIPHGDGIVQPIPAPEYLPGDNPEVPSDNFSSLTIQQMGQLGKLTFSSPKIPDNISSIKKPRGGGFSFTKELLEELAATHTQPLKGLGSFPQKPTYEFELENPLIDIPSSLLPKLEVNTPEYLGPAEERLRSHFRRAVSGLSVEEAARLQPDRKLPRNIGDYELVPITGNGSKTHSAYSPGTLVHIPAGVTCKYGQQANSAPWLDSNYAIGLTYQGSLAAVAAAYIAEDGQLRIVQLQGVNATASNPKLKYKTGLHSGFYWRDTLVQAWLTIAPELGIKTMEIQGAANNKWLTEKRKHLLPQFVNGYDDVAQRMGFQPTPSGDWSMLV